MLPGKKKELIILGISIIAIIIVIIIMYNLAKFMNSRGNNTNTEVVDDPYVADYVYYGFTIDTDNNYQLMAMDAEFNEVSLNLRSFYPMNNLYYYNNHLVLYTDAINQINYNNTENTYTFYELNSFYSNNTDVLITPEYYIFVTDDVLEYCLVTECNRTKITDTLGGEVLYNEGSIYYQSSDGIHEFNLEEGSDNLIIEGSNLVVVATDEDYLLYLNNNNYYAYRYNNGTTTNISASVLEENPEYEYVGFQNSYFIYKIVDEAGDYVLRKYSLRIRDLLRSTLNMEQEDIVRSFPLTDDLMYAELKSDNMTRYVIMNIDEFALLKDLANPYAVLIGVDTSA